jgi:hypothetical protein
MTEEQLADEVKQVLKANPDLTDGGIGVPKRNAKGEWHGRWTTQVPELEAAHRAFYQVDIAHLSRVVAWLQRWPRTKSVNRRAPSSYVMKHIVERDLDEYVSNGEFILAALIVGLQIRRHLNHPNVGLNLTHSGCQPCGRCGQPIVHGRYGGRDGGHDHDAVPCGLDKPARDPQWRHRRAVLERELIRRALAEARV